MPNEGGRQEEVFSILVVFFAVGTISGKSLKLLPAGVIFYSYNAPYSISAAGGAYSAPPDPSAAFKGPTSKGKERGMRRGRHSVARPLGQSTRRHCCSIRPNVVLIRPCLR